ncbi:hypothetical protein B0H17DRAFT_1216104 [Mycena rosella]|uniref:DUF6535 domain-containing protein n=1 Tax=Mycena rosella TaxID=1033263 RepID=A0AAD7CDA2_MYCRO|nr:hypothetical protein B0H17DRAFT_1216104 [Mycena rosella]
MATTNVPLDLNNVAGMAELISLMKEQLSVIQRIDHRQAAADVSAQPFPQVPETSSSVWGALLRSRIAETIQPQVDRWRSGLDALLVFLGLFSAIVTAFLVNSLTGLQQDEAARTNELLANLTEIVIQLSAGATLSTLKVAPPTSFLPDAVDVRLNSYWTISLILSLSIAALAVACRGFVNMTMLSSRKKAVDKVVDINTRWKAAEKMLGPTLEIIPQLVVIPVILFVVGLLDSIFSAVLGLEVLPAPVVAASALSLFFVAGVVAFLAFTLVDASSRPHSSPFQSTLAHAIAHGVCKVLGLVDPAVPIKSQSRTISTYYEIVQVTHDDETLDKAASALGEIIGLPSQWLWNKLPDNIRNTLIHLLSPEASTRCNHTAARIIVDLGDVLKDSDDPDGTQSLLSSLADAARRSANNRPLATLWTSTYIKACANIVGAFHKDHPPVVCILGSNYATRLRYERIDSMDNLILSVFSDHLDRTSPDGCPTPPLVQLFEPDFIVPQNVMRFLAHLRLGTFSISKALGIILLLIAAKTPVVVISAARKQMTEGGISAEMVGWLIAQAVLDLPEQAADWEDVHLLKGLCSLCLDVAESYSYRRRITETVNATLARLPPTGVASTVLTKLMKNLRESYPDLFPDVLRPSLELIQPATEQGGDGSQRKQGTDGADSGDSGGSQEYSVPASDASSDSQN